MNKAPVNELVYKELLVAMKQQVRSVQAKAALAVNSSLIQLYWNMGRMIAENQELFEGKNSYVAQLERDLRAEFPDIKGFSRSNLFYIRKFYQFYQDVSVQQLVGLNEKVETTSVQQLVALNPEGSVQQPAGLSIILLSLPWGHHMLLLDKIKKVDEALFYVQQTIEYNWSRAILTLQIEQNLYQRQGKAITNFTTTLPEQQALMAVQMLKDPYNFGFLTLEPKVQELESACDVL